MRLLASFALLPAAMLGLGFGGAQQDVTLTASSLIAVTGKPVVLSGQISSGRAGELVTVQGKECGVPGAFFRALAAVQTTEGGFWSRDFYPASRVVIRATWGDDLSPTLTVQKRASVYFSKERDGTFAVSVYGNGRFAGKQVVIERFDRATRTWRRVRTVVLQAETGGYGEKDGLRFKVPRGTTIRAVLPLSQAKPCYLAGYSKLVRT